MFQLHGSDGRIPCAGQERKSHQRAVAALDLAPFWHGLNHMLHLLQRRGFPFALRRRDARIFLRQVEVVRIGILKARLVPWLPGQPEKERFQLLQRGVQSSLAQLLPGPLPRLLRKMPLERYRLLKVVRLKAPIPGLQGVSP